MVAACTSYPYSQGAKLTLLIFSPSMACATLQIQCLVWQHQPKQRCSEFICTEHFRRRKKYHIPIRISTLAGARHGAAFDTIECGGEWEFDIRIVQRYTSAWELLGDVMTVQYRQKFYISESYISRINCIYIFLTGWKITVTSTALPARCETTIAIQVTNIIVTLPHHPSLTFGSRHFTNYSVDRL